MIDLLVFSNVRSLQDNQSLLLTPFERNLEVWRQLWRTCERSDLVVQIVDARNPLASRSEDLEKYVLELNLDIDGDGVGERAMGNHRVPRKNLLLINKSDLLTRLQRSVRIEDSCFIFSPFTLPSREGWADYFEEHQIQYAFFSAANSTALQEERARLAALVDDELGEDSEDSSGGSDTVDSIQRSPTQQSLEEEDAEEQEEEAQENSDSDSELAGRLQRGAGISTPGSDEADRTRILSVSELEHLFLRHAPEGLQGSFNSRSFNC